jgi:hypothetical protein
MAGYAFGSNPPLPAMPQADRRRIQCLVGDDQYDPAAVGPRGCPILHSPPSTSPFVAQGDSLAGTLHTGPAGPVVSNTPAFHGRANSPVDTNQTVPRGLTGDQPLRKWRIQKG